MMKKIALVLGTLGFLAVSGVAFAQTTSTPVQQMVLQVGPAGKVLLRGTVDAASAASITVKGWGGDWTINIPSSARILPQGATLSSFQKGDFVGVQGTVNQSGSWTIDATLVRDWTARQALNQQIKTNVQSVHDTMSAGPKTIQGTLSNLDATAETFTLTASGGAAYSVSLASGAKLLARNWATLDFSKVSNGDTVRVYGAVSSATISATIFRDVSVK